MSEPDDWMRNLMAGSVTPEGSTSKTWVYVAPECTCSEDEEDPDCPAIKSWFCGHYTFEAEATPRTETSEP